MQILFKIILLIFAVLSSLTILSQLTQYPLIILISLSIIGMLGLLIQKKLYKKFLQQFKFIYETFNIEIPSSIKNIYASGMELAFIFILASIGVNPVTDIIEGKINTAFSYNIIFFELALISTFFAIIPTFIYIFYYFIKNPEEN